MGSLMASIQIVKLIYVTVNGVQGSSCIVFGWSIAIPRTQCMSALRLCHMTYASPWPSCCHVVQSLQLPSKIGLTATCQVRGTSTMGYRAWMVSDCFLCRKNSG